ncbi:hypothetical protein RHMOL_Rhmol04G0349600 [Rhododendron molle]|uniref:Uncharacterized protein n=1 Tax=Rhododendron molle TaxID=49168 RepID=A0ACC0P7H3_RHOML|nr:hypothetical protein RHMOL_Rhmol04G0349600 [Rhododendron molle]
MARSGGHSFGWIRRQANGVAHHVAALAKRRDLPPSWIASPPFSLFTHLCNDVSL